MEIVLAAEKLRSTDRANAGKAAAQFDNTIVLSNRWNWIIHIVKAQEKSRRQLVKNVSTELKVVSKGSGWKFARGNLFRECEGWFVHIESGPWVLKPRTTAAVHLKPMSLDLGFWEIVDTRGKVHEPLSFRMFSAWTCGTPEYRETEINEEAWTPGQSHERSSPGQMPSWLKRREIVISIASWQ